MTTKKQIVLYLTKNKRQQLSKGMHYNYFKIEARRRQVASMLAHSMTESEIAERLNVANVQSAEMSKL